MNDISKEIKVWDPAIRIFHWSLVAAFVIAYASEDDFMTIHTYAGYTIIGLLTFRVVWGFIGTRHARFSDFVCPPNEIVIYLKEMVVLKAKHYLGHNPAGGAMIMALLASLFITTLTGLCVYGIEGGGPFAGWLAGVGGFIKDVLEDVHEFFANFILLLICIHVAGVILSGILHAENLVRAMFTGIKQH